MGGYSFREKTNTKRMGYLCRGGRRIRMERCEDIIAHMFGISDVFRRLGSVFREWQQVCKNHKLELKLRLNLSSSSNFRCLSYSFMNHYNVRASWFFDTNSDISSQNLHHDLRLCLRCSQAEIILLPVRNATDHCLSGLCTINQAILPLRSRRSCSINDCPTDKLI